MEEIGFEVDRRTIAAHNQSLVRRIRRFLSSPLTALCDGRRRNSQDFAIFVSLPTLPHQLHALATASINDADVSWMLAMLYADDVALSMPRPPLGSLVVAIIYALSCPKLKAFVKRK
jgi:hypothetical protein